MTANRSPACASKLLYRPALLPDALVAQHAYFGTSAGTAIPRPDRSWDALFESGAQIVPDGYTAEMAIPLKSLRYPRRPEGETHRWGLQIVREIKDKDQENIV